MTAEITNTDRHDLITPAKLRAWNTCWRDERIAAHFAGRAALTAREIASDESLVRSDRMWVLTNALARKDIWLPYDFSLGCAEQARMKLPSEWQLKLAPVFDPVRALRCGTCTDAADVADDVARVAAWAIADAARADTAQAAQVYQAAQAASWAVAAWAVAARSPDTDDVAWDSRAARAARATTYAARAVTSTAAWDRLLNMLEN